MPSHGSRLRLTAAALLAGAFVPAARLSSQAPPTRGTIVRSDARMDALIPKDAALEKLADGFDWSEGPVWEREGRATALLGRARTTSFTSGRKAKAWASSCSPAATRGPSRSRGREPGTNGLTFDRPGAADALPARRPPRRPTRDAGPVHDHGRPLRGQAVQQPERSRLQVERRPLLHRPALRPAPEPSTTRAGRSRSTASTGSRRRAP